MSIKITLSMEDGNPVVDMTSEFSQKDVELTPEEADAVGLVMAAAGSYAALLHCERRTDSYLSIVGPEYGDDFCRIKVGSRSCWISLDLWRCDVSDDPRLSAVKNKRQRHWKIPLSSVSEISSLGDLIQTSLKATSLAER